MTTKAPYRNSLRSKKMIKRAFLQLICVKDISKIKVLEITDLADISKGTFYTHFHDVYNVLEDIENECISGMIEVLKQNTAETILDDLSPFLKTVFDGLEREKEKYTFLIKSTCSTSFLYKLQQAFVNYMLSYTQIVARIKTPEQASLFFSFIAVGISNIVHQWILGNADISLVELSTQLNGCIINGISTILK